jgi:hypothetical protein
VSRDDNSRSVKTGNFCINQLCSVELDEPVVSANFMEQESFLRSYPAPHGVTSQKTST